MLTRDEINEAARLMQQVGELRPGYLHADTSDLEGPVGSYDAPAALVGSTPASGEGTVRRPMQKIRVTMVVDDETGETLVVQE